MASFHASAKIGKKGKGFKHSQYIGREGQYSGYDRYEDLAAVGSGNMPAWAVDNPSEFWKASDSFERKNGSVYKEYELALPRELTDTQNVALIADFVSRQIGALKPYQWAMHVKAASIDGGEQPHAHIMESQRMVDGIERDPEQYFKRYDQKMPGRGGARKDSGKHPAQLKVELLAMRKLWADVQNAHLERHGHAVRVDHRSLKEQGIDRIPERHLGPDRAERLTPGEVEHLVETRQVNAEAQLVQVELSAAIGDVIVDLTSAQNTVMAEEMVELEAHYQATIKANAERKAQRHQAMLADQERVARFEARERAAAAQRDALAAQAESDKRKEMEAAAVAAAPATRYPQALAEVTTETLATVPGILPAAAIQQAVAERIAELQAIRVAPPVSIALLGMEVVEQPVYQRRLANADDMDARAQKTLDDVASMGKLKRMLNNADALEASAQQLRKDAQLERRQVDNAVALSPEMREANSANDRSENRRLQIKQDIKEVEEIALRTQRGESAWRQPSHVYRLPEAVTKVLDRAREIAVQMIAKMQAIDVEALLKRAIEMKWTKPERVNDMTMMQSKFVATPENAKLKREYDQAQALANERASKTGRGPSPGGR